MNTERDPAAIDVWLTFYQEIEIAKVVPELRALLTAEERDQERRFHFADDQRRYLVTRALVRSVLSRYVEVPPIAWRFRPDEFGRPQVINTEWMRTGKPALQFNLSHTAGLIVLAIAPQRAIGVDVENVLARNVSIDVADHFFSPREVSDLYRLPESQRPQRFFEYWTFKESYIKARGMGLHIPLDKFSFGYDADPEIEFFIAPELHDRVDRWAFWQFRPSHAHLLAVCAERGAEMPIFNFHKIIPGGAEEILQLQVRKAVSPTPVRS